MPAAFGGARSRGPAHADFGSARSRDFARAADSGARWCAYSSLPWVNPPYGQLPLPSSFLEIGSSWTKKGDMRIVSSG